MTNDTVLTIGAAAFVGLAVGYFASEASKTRLHDKLDSQIEAGVEATAAQVATLEGKITGLEKALAAVGTSQAESAAALDGKLDEAVKGLTARIDAVSADVGKAVADAGSAQTDQIEAALSGGMKDLQGSIAALALAPAADDAGAGDDSLDQTRAAAAPAEPKIEGVTIGQTEYLMDGKVRVFVSSIMEEDGMARVAVNGQDVMLIGAWHDGDFLIGEVECNVTLDAIVEGHLQMSAACEE